MEGAAPNHAKPLRRALQLRFGQGGHSWVWIGACGNQPYAFAAHPKREIKIGLVQQSRPMIKEKLCRGGQAVPIDRCHKTDITGPPQRRYKIGHERAERWWIFRPRIAKGRQSGGAKIKPITAAGEGVRRMTRQKLGVSTFPRGGQKKQKRTGRGRAHGRTQPCVLAKEKPPDAFWHPGAGCNAPVASEGQHNQDKCAALKGQGGVTRRPSSPTDLTWRAGARCR